MKWQHFAGVLCVLLFAFPAPAQVTLVVDDDGQATPASCDDSTAAFTTVGAAIAAAGAGDTVLVCPGTYIENVNFGGKPITVRSVAGPAVTILDGDSAGTVVTFASGEGASSILEGFTIRNGLASFDGGGIHISGASPVIRHNVVVRNRACGAAVRSEFGSPLIEENIIARNIQAGCIGGGYGGGVAIGGASSAVIRRNQIEGNIGAYSGGGISLWAAGTPTIEFNLIAGNSATSEGGGISMFNNADALIRGNVIVDNRAPSGGGVYWLVPSSSGGPLLVNNTIVGNDAPSGSGIYADGFDGGVLLVNNNIVAAAGQSAVTCGNFDSATIPAFRSNNVFSATGVSYGGLCPDQTTVNGNISVDPLFVSPAARDYHLLPGSPLVDAGDNSAPSLPTMDFDSAVRIVDGNSDGGAVVDIGADEAATGDAGAMPAAFGKTSPVNATQNAPLTISIKWEASAGATSYEYCYDTVDNGTCDDTWLPAWSSTSATLPTLGAGTTYFWQVRANNSAGSTYANGSTSAYSSFATNATNPGVFGKTTPADGAQGQWQAWVAVSWNASIGALGYDYCYDTVNNGRCDSTWIPNGSSTDTALVGLNYGTTYYWQVRANSPATTTYANGGESAFWSFTTQVAPPGAFTKSSPVNRSQDRATSLTISWQASAGATSYEYCYDTINNDFCDGTWTTVTGTTQELTGLISGQIYYWQVRAFNAGGVAVANGDTWWSWTTTFDGDGYSEVVFQHESTGCMVVWHMQGAALKDQQWITPNCVGDPAWRIAGMADFDGDGKLDLLFQNVRTGGLVVWLMDGVTYRRQVWLTPSGVSDPNWRVSAIGDFDGDGPPDLILQNTATGGMVAWLLNGTTLKTQQWLTPGFVADPKWRIVGAGDIDGDGKPDLFFQNIASGYMVAWIMNGLAITRQEWISPNQVDPSWRIFGVADVNGDGRRDLLFQNVTDGRMVVWFLRGTALIDQSWLGTGQVADPRWRISAAR